jgi:hypothetical protein
VAYLENYIKFCFKLGTDATESFKCSFFERREWEEHKFLSDVSYSVVV